MVGGRAQSRVSGRGGTQPPVGGSVVAHGHAGTTGGGKPLRPAAFAGPGSLSRPGVLPSRSEGLPGHRRSGRETGGRKGTRGAGPEPAPPLARARRPAGATPGRTGPRQAGGEAGI